MDLWRDDVVQPLGAFVRSRILGADGLYPFHVQVVGDVDALVNLRVHEKAQLVRLLHHARQELRRYEAMQQRHAHRAGGHQSQPAKDVQAIDALVHAPLGIEEDVGHDAFQPGHYPLVVERHLAAHHLLAVFVAVLSGYGIVPPPLGPAALLVAQTHRQEARRLDFVTVAQEFVPGDHLGRHNACLLKDGLVVVDARRADLCRDRVVFAADGDHVRGKVDQPVFPTVLIVVRGDVGDQPFFDQELEPVATVAIE